MRHFSYTTNRDDDAPKVLSQSISVFGSLAASRETWARLLFSMGWDTRLKYHDAAHAAAGSVADEACRLTSLAVPEEGEIHPQRASWALMPADENHSEPYVLFHTPGGVVVEIQRGGMEGTVYLAVDFQRDSHFCATCLIARLFESTGDGSLCLSLINAASGRHR